MSKPMVYMAMLQLVNQIHVLKNQTKEPDTAIAVENLLTPLAVVLEHLETCPHRRRDNG